MPMVNQLSIPSVNHVTQPQKDRLIIRVLRFIRIYLNVSTRDIAAIMEGEYHSRSMVAAIENETRMSNPNFITDYARAIQKKSKLESNILAIIEKCLEDKRFIKNLDKIEKGDYDFYTIYSLTSKIWELNLRLIKSTRQTDINVLKE